MKLKCYSVVIQLLYTVTQLSLKSETSTVIKNIFFSIGYCCVNFSKLFPVQFINLEIFYYYIKTKTNQVGELVRNKQRQKTNNVKSSQN